jgi:hypothetical protein
MLILIRILFAILLSTLCISSILVVSCDILADNRFLRTKIYNVLMVRRLSFMQNDEDRKRPKIIV